MNSPATQVQNQYEQSEPWLLAQTRCFHCGLLMWARVLRGAPLRDAGSTSLGRALPPTASMATCMGWVRPWRSLVPDRLAERWCHRWHQTRGALEATILCLLKICTCRRKRNDIMLNYFVRFIRLDGENKARFRNRELYINLGSAQSLSMTIR